MGGPPAEQSLLDLHAVQGRLGRTVWSHRAVTTAPPLTLISAFHHFLATLFTVFNKLKDIEI